VKEEEVGGKGNKMGERPGRCCALLRTLVVMVSQVRCEAVRANGWWEMKAVAQCMDARVVVSFELPCFESATYPLVHICGWRTAY